MKCGGGVCLAFVSLLSWIVQYSLKLYSCMGVFAVFVTTMVGAVLGSRRVWESLGGCLLHCCPVVLFVFCELVGFLCLFLFVL